MKTAARRASRRLIVLTGLGRAPRPSRRPPRPRRRTSASSASRDAFLHGRADLGEDAAVGDERAAARRARVRPSSSTPSRRRPLRSCAPSTDATARRRSRSARPRSRAPSRRRPATSTRLKCRPATAAARRPPRGRTSSTRRCGTRRCRGCRAARRASSARLRSRTRPARGARARSPGGGCRRRRSTFAISES